MNDMDIIQALGYDVLYAQVVSYLVFFFQWFPYWGPFFLGFIFWHEWVHYIQAKWRANIKWVLLEVKLPKEIHKTPVAMEIALGALYQTGNEGTWYDRSILGKQRDWFSLEMVSFEGNVKFFIRTSYRNKNVIEAQLYAQYPDIEIYEVPDYTRYVDYKTSGGEYEMISEEFKLDKPDPYPIKTYVDFGLDKEGVKEEFKTDPITSIIEYLGAIGKGEQIWIQIIVRAAKPRYHKKDGSKGDWKDEAREIIDKITKRKETTEEGVPLNLRLTKGEQEVVAAIERSMDKLGFDCGARAIYIAKKEKYSFTQINAMKGIFRAFDSKNLNSFTMRDCTFGWDFPWQSYISFKYIFPQITFDKDYFIRRERKEQFDAYKHRSWFYPPRKLTPFVLTAEELATVFHFPGGVAQTPTFGRVPSRKGEAPINLPI